MPHHDLGPVQLRFDEHGRPIPMSLEEKKIRLEAYLAELAILDAEPDTDPPGTEEAIRRYFAARRATRDHGASARGKRSIQRWLSGTSSMLARSGLRLKTRRRRSLMQASSSWRSSPPEGG